MSGWAFGGWAVCRRPSQSQFEALGGSQRFLGRGVWHVSLRHMIPGVCGDPGSGCPGLVWALLPPHR